MSAYPMHRPAARRRAAMLACPAALLAGALGCTAADPRAQLSSRYAPDRAGAIVRLAERGDREAIHALVDLLEDDDPAVRMYAILALERLTGETRGYRYYDSEARRAPAVQRWRTALREGQVRPGAARPEASAPGTWGNVSADGGGLAQGGSGR
ncbi:MAG: HEAT repeat domain-containing protein [Phycisphaerae bacterium]|nr:HEAT repeat domain-containing protein [Phycisphaerae bacterium]MCZ2400426.1 HEAT repeat domain-containing protein [Phycisphaerae bacterium]